MDLTPLKPSHRYFPASGARAIQRVTINGVDVPVHYTYYGNTHRNIEHGGILCVAYAKHNDVLFGGIALVPNVMPGGAKPTEYHVFEKPVVRNIAWLRLCHAATGNWYRPVLENTINRSRVRFKTPQGLIRVPEEAICRPLGFVVDPYSIALRESFRGDEFMEHPDEAVFLRRIIDDLAAAHVVPDWTIALEPSSAYPHVDGKLRQRVHDFREDLMDMEIIADKLDGRAESMLIGGASAEIDELLGIRPAEIPRIITSTYGNVKRHFPHNDRITWPSDDEINVTQDTKLFALAQVSFGDDMRPNVIVPLTDWALTAEDIGEDLASTLDAFAYAERRVIYDIVDVFENRDKLVPEDAEVVHADQDYVTGVDLVHRIDGRLDPYGVVDLDEDEDEEEDEIDRILRESQENQDEKPGEDWAP